MTWKRHALVVVGRVVVVGTVLGESAALGVIHHRYQTVVESRRQLEQRFGTMQESHERLVSDLEHERQRAAELAETLAGMQVKVDEVVGRLTEESRTVKELEGRLAAMRAQMDQLQSELALALQQPAHQAAGPSSPVHLDRVIVSRAGATAIQGRVMSVHPDWHFVIIDVGWDTVKIGDTVSILRNEQVLAKARVERVQEGVSAATVLPEWQAVEIRVNDFVQLL
ncbi:MAG: hypothetical protein Q8R91_01605 [Candidatus Omnitrophota bacterium]|nr:hypothetical protein [Candidatus Omnitrophota bacterium]